MLFTWNPKKAETNRRKHRVPFDEARTVFDDPLARSLSDPDHSLVERRELMVGRSSRGRLLMVGFTERRRSIQLIFSRVLTRVEIQDYEEDR